MKALESKLEKSQSHVDKLKKEREKSEASILELTVELDDLRADKLELTAEAEAKVSPKEVEVERKRQVINQNSIPRSLSGYEG